MSGGRRERLIRNCETCGKPFAAKPYKLAMGYGKFCSKSCASRPAETRFWTKVTKANANECWPWLGGKSGGYGTFYYEGKVCKAHRFAYTLLVGLIPDGLVIDHLCRNRGCVNPAHMEPVTPLENTRRGDAHLSMKRFSAAQTHCRKGHDLASSSRDNSGECLVCRRERGRRLYWRRRQNQEPAAAHNRSTAMMPGVGQ